MQTHIKTSINEAGFSMIEVLVTMVVVAIALLGAAGLQTYAMKTNMGGQYRNQAAFFMSDIIDRMEANKAAAATGSYALAAGSVGAASTACNTGPCSSAQLAADDLSNWLFQVGQVLPQGTGVIVANGNSTYTITVNWIDRASDKNAAAKSELFAITTTRTIR